MLELEDVGLVFKSTWGNHYFPDFLEFYESLEEERKGNKTIFFAKRGNNRLRLFTVEDMTEMDLVDFLREILWEMALERYSNNRFIFAGGKVVISLRQIDVYGFFSPHIPYEEEEEVSF